MTISSELISRYLKIWWIALFAWVVTVPAFAAERPTILILGDSISAAYGMEVEQGWVALLAERLREKEYPHEVVNASISGDTSGGGLMRFPPLLEAHRPALLVLELGGNDGLRGLSLSRMRRNLARIIEAAEQTGTRVLLVGMRLPPNYGAEYTAMFHHTYADLATEYDLSLVPFIARGVEGRLDQLQADGIHPGPKLQDLLLENVWMQLAPMLESTGPETPTAVSGETVTLN